MNTTWFEPQLCLCGWHSRIFLLICTPTLSGPATRLAQTQYPIQQSELNSLFWNIKPHKSSGINQHYPVTVHYWMCPSIQVRRSLGCGPFQFEDDGAKLNVQLSVEILGVSRRGCRETIWISFTWLPLKWGVPAGYPPNEGSNSVWCHFPLHTKLKYYSRQRGRGGLSQVRSLYIGLLCVLLVIAIHFYVVLFDSAIDI